MNFSPKAIRNVCIAALAVIFSTSCAAEEWAYLSASKDGKKDFYNPSTVYRKRDVARIDIIVNHAAPFGVDPKKAFLSSMVKWEFDCLNSKGRIYGERKTFSGLMATGRLIEVFSMPAEYAEKGQQPWLPIRSGTLAAARLQKACGPEAKK